jgi:hypothetical protein
MEEETGCLNLDILKVNWKKALYIEYSYKKKTKKVYYFLAEVPEGVCFVFVVVFTGFQFCFSLC